MEKKKLYAIKRITWDQKAEYFDFCMLEWVSEANFDNFCLSNKDLAEHYAKQAGIEELVTFDISFTETGKEVI